MSRLPLIIDCDPGVDDAVALFLAFAAPERFDLLGITTVAGNVGATLTARNARIVRQIAGRADVPVIAGCERPLVREPVEAGDFHGESGLGTLPIFEPDAPALDGRAAPWLVETLMARGDGEVVIAALGPLTNLAVALILEPKIASRIARIVLMGGASREGGNITPSAEYNIFADPHAARVVFESGIDLVVMGLDVTHQVLADGPRITALEAVGTAAARASAELLRFSAGVEADLKERPGAPLHDPCTIAWLLAPELFTLEAAEIRVETDSALTFGHTQVDLRPRAGRANARWAVAADADGVFALLNERLAREVTR